MKALEDAARIDTSLPVRRRAASLSQDAGAIGAMLGRHWTTPTNEAQAEELCVAIAADALALRAEIIKARKVREAP